ncbi:hypothetical protein ACIP5Y_19650 [Nocardia sp. NPDC088792]|uniref:hypothetical protein n=1 Tax=Nocardia sp. NPDC088792 TaxID=3364332 RepID=UPI0037F2B536
MREPTLRKLGAAVAISTLAAFPLRTGSDTPITLTFSDGSTNSVTAPVRDQN